MSERLKHAVVLLALTLIVVVGAVWGAAALVQPFPSSEPKDDPSEPPVCTDHQVVKGTRVRPEMVTVTVWNASDRAGLASTTMEQLITKGFVKGDLGNAPEATEVQTVEIWTGDTAGPAAKLVQSWFGPKSVIVSKPDLGTTITVVVGKDYRSLAQGKPFVITKADALVCGPADA